MSFLITSSLDSGDISSLFEVLALFLGLLIAGNLQSIAGLSARRRLYAHGTSRLGDANWNLGIIEGLVSPRRLVHDFRVFLAFALSLIVTALEVLTVLQTESSESCGFNEASSWEIVKSTQTCFLPSGKIEFESTRSFASSKYVNDAIEKVKTVDLRVGIPVQTTVAEKSIITGKAVQQLKNGNLTLTYTAPVMDVFESAGGVHFQDGRPISNVAALNATDKFSVGACKSDEGISEESVDFPRKTEFSDFGRNNSLFLSAFAGFVQVQPCVDVFAVRVCDFPKGRHEMKRETEASDMPEFQVQCKVHVISREGRRTDARFVGSALFDNDNVDSQSIRRAVLASLISQNSASSVPCERFTASPKKCTQIGYISAGAVLGIILVFILTSVVRLGLTYTSRHMANYNGSPKRVAETMFNYFQGMTRAADPVQTVHKKKRELVLGHSPKDDDIYLSVTKSNKDFDSYRLAWTRGPLAGNPSAHIPSEVIVPYSDEWGSESVETSLV